MRLESQCASFISLWVGCRQTSFGDIEEWKTFLCVVIVVALLRLLIRHLTHFSPMESLLEAEQEGRNR
jgi:hypothetical protein